MGQAIPSEPSAAKPGVIHFPGVGHEGSLTFLAEATGALLELAGVDTMLCRIAQLAVPQFADWSGLALKDATGHFRQVIAGEDAPREAGLREDVFRTGKPVVLDNFLCVPIVSDESEVTGTLAFATESGRYGESDLHVIEELARRVLVATRNAELVRHLQEADRRKDEFLAVLAHELRNPLAPVRNAVEILRATQPTSPQLNWTYDVIDRQVRQMTRLVDDLLDISRITTGKLELRKERIELGATIRMAAEACRPHIERAGHELTMHLPSQPIWIQADSARLAQIFSNLLHNAAKFTPPGGHIWVNAKLRDGRVLVRIGDDGMGISPDMLGKIFDMFTQGGSPEERSQGGLGIGLTLVKRLAELHGGTVQAHSDGPSKGSEFVVCLPVLALPAATSPARRATDAQDNAPQRRILVVDDNRDAADSLAMLLRARGHDVRVAYDGIEAVGAAVAFSPEIVLMDIGLPKLDGHNAARRIREAMGRDVFLAAITGWGQDEDRQRSLDAGFDTHLTKPVDPEAITRLIEDN